MSYDGYLAEAIEPHANTTDGMWLRIFMRLAEAIFDQPYVLPIGMRHMAMIRRLLRAGRLWNRWKTGRGY